jgi:threonine/homoserine/homoserine lactone efflux protein
MIDSAALATYSFVMAITPGPNNVMLTASGANFGFRRTLPHIVGICIGFSVVLLSVCAGLDVIFTRWPQLQSVLRWAGAAYLIYLGWRILHSRETKEGSAPQPLTLLQAAAFQFLNPKCWIMTLTAAAMFLPHDVGFIANCAYLIGLMGVVMLPCSTIWALFGSSMRVFLARPSGRTIFNALMAVALTVTGIAMVM